MANISIFKNESFGEVRVAGTSEEPLFCLADVCKVLELRQGDVRQRLDEGVVSTQPLETAGGVQQANFVNEDGLYDVILDSRKPQAREFRKWITSEVLPSIRKTGGYMTATADETPEQIMARALMLAKETIDRQQDALLKSEQHRQLLTAENMEQARKIEQDAPRVRFSVAVETSDTSCLMAQLAKLLTQNGVLIGQNRLYKWMRDNGYLCKKGQYYNQPTQKAMQLKLFETKTTTITKPDGKTIVTITTKVTGKGQVYFVDKFMKMYGRQKDFAV